MTSETTPAERQRMYWRANLRLIGAMVGIWFLVTFALSYFAKAFAHFMFFGWPLPFFVGAQGALFVYLGIVWYYAKAMSDLDDRYGQDDEVSPE